MWISKAVERLQAEADRAREELFRLREEVEKLKRQIAAEKPEQAADGTAKTGRKRTARKTAETAGTAGDE